MSAQRTPGTDRQRVVLHTRVVNKTGGGPDKTILNSPRFLREHGYDAICAYMRHPDDPGFAELEKRARHWQAPLVAIDDRGPADWKILNRFQQVCTKYDPRIWHGHDYKSNLLGLVTRRHHPMSLVTTVHGWGVQRTWKTPVYHAIDRLCLRFYDLVICVSQDLFDTCVRLGVSRVRCHLVPNAIDTLEYSKPATQTGDQGGGSDPQRLVIGAVGRLSREKGFHLLIEAVHELVGEGLDLELQIAGEGGIRAALEDQIGRLGIAGRVKLLGYQPDMPDFYRGLDAFVVSSLSEGLPNGLLEAMAFELPVVSTRCGGIPSVVEDAENGLLTQPGSAAGLATGIRRLALDSELRCRLGGAARATIVRDFSFEQRMRKIRTLYDQVLRP